MILGIVSVMIIMEVVIVPDSQGTKASATGNAQGNALAQHPLTAQSALPTLTGTRMGNVYVT